MAENELSLRERKKRETQERILDAALDLFQQHGFEDTSIDQIAAAADISRGTFFNYFGTKEHLLSAIADGELGEGNPGFVNRGLGYTKSIFLRQAGRYAPQLEDPGYRRVLDQLVPRRVQLAVHSPTGRRDRPARARPLLEAFRAAHAGRTWIDHQPDTNCEAIANQGWNPSSRWYMLGHLRDLAFVYLWSGLDLPLSPGSLNLLAPELAARRRPTLYARNGLDGRGPRFVMFSSAYLFLKRERLLALLSEPSLDRLSAERGLLIGHVYLDTGRSNGRFRKRALIEERGAGFYRIRPEVDQLFRSGPTTTAYLSFQRG